MVALRAKAFIVCTVALSFFSVFSQTTTVADKALSVETTAFESDEKAQLLEEGLSAYNNKDYANAIILLREAVAGGSGNPDVHYMLIMSEMYAEDYASVIADCNKFSASYPDSPLLSNVSYQKGKALHYKGENDQAVMVLSDFCHETPQSPVYPSALYWIAECFYEDYNFEMAEGLFQRIIDVYPEDKKAVDAKYKIDAIAQREREQKLLDILKANNERFLDQKANYERQLKGLENADIATLKKELAEANARIKELEKLLAEEKAAAALAAEEAEKAKDELKQAESVDDNASDKTISQSPESQDTKKIPSSPPAQGVTEQELLELKLRASQLQRLLDEKYSASRENKAE